MCLMAAVLDSTSIDQWFSTEGSIAPTGDICQCLEIFLVITIGKGCYWYLVAETRDDAKHPTTHRTALYNKELSGLKCQ